MTKDTVSKAGAYWKQFLATRPATDPVHTEQYVAEPFGDSPALADELAALIVSGRKTATCSALWEWEAEGNPIPIAGLKSIVLDGCNEPVCIIETTEVTIRRYDEVDDQFAADEGEGDRSLTYWREAHWRFFTRTLSKMDKAPALDMPLVCERFRMIYR